MNKKVLITGCSRGLGKSLLEEFSLKGYKVFPHFRNQCKIKYANKIIGNINEIKTINLIERKIKENDVDIFINNAGVFSNKDFFKMTDQEIQDLISTNLLAPILLTKRILEIFLNRKRGIIINIDSLAFQNPSDKEIVYTASKFGLTGFSKALQIKLVNSGVQIKDFFIGKIQSDKFKNLDNFQSLLQPKEVSNFIIESLENSYNSFNCNEYFIRRKYN